MKSIYKLSFLALMSVAILASCSSKKRKKGGGDPSALSKFYHNTTALYNGYFNANELLQESYATLRLAHSDNYNEILPLYDYVSVSDPKSVAADLDKAIEKVTTVAALHKPSKWVDDCYVLMGEAQYLKQEYETAEETFAYFKDEFNPTNPFGRNYKKKKKSKKAIKKEKEKERKEEKKKRDEEKEKKKKKKEEDRKAKKKAKEEADKARKKEKERLKKEREAEKKRRSKKKSKKRGGKKKRPKKRDTKKDEVVEEKKEETITPKVEVPAKEIKEEEKTEKPNPRSEEKEEETDYSDSSKKKEKKKKDKTAYSEGMMWYAKSLVKREKFSNASYLVKRMKEDGLMPEKARREVPVILADINIQEKNYPAAIEYLKEAIELANEKSLKARYAFVQGQLYQMAKDNANASEAFRNAKKWSKSFEMEFMAEINAEKSEMMSGSKSDDKVLAKLDRMVKEDKYVEYLDQLYFTKGEILLERGQFAEALKSFSKSIVNNVDNIALKQETYYKLAYLFYDKESYVEAKYYFDSTLTVLDKEDARYRDVSNYSNNLTEIATNIEAIKLQDSLLGMVAWSDDKIESLAEKLIEENMQASLNTGKTGSAPARKSSSILNGKGGGFKSSSFFAYDEVAKQRGKKDFDDRWGEIELADNWRRNDKSDVFGSGDDENDGDEEKIAEDGFQEDEISKMISSIKSQIPYSDEAKAGINGNLQKSLFELGKAYRDKIQNYEKAVTTHEDLLRRFPEFDQKLDVYYYLYLSYLDLNNSTKSNFYKEKILSEYPETEFAQAISDPNFGKNNLSAEEKLNKYYEETYELFEKGEYQESLNKAEQASTIFGKDNDLKPKFALVKAMSTGSVHGKEKYIEELQDVVTRYPNTPEKARADEILRFLRGDEDAFTGIDMKEVDDLFKIEDEKLHYVAVVMYDTNADKLVNAKISVSNYNKQYHKLKKLQLGDSPLDRKKKTEVILIRRFENKGKAMDYYNEIIKSQEEFISNELGAYNIYAITQRNYRKMIIERGDARYKLFFEKHYLSK